MTNLVELLLYSLSWILSYFQKWLGLFFYLIWHDSLEAFRHILFHVRLLPWSLLSRLYSLNVVHVRFWNNFILRKIRWTCYEIFSFWRITYLLSLWNIFRLNFWSIIWLFWFLSFFICFIFSFLLCLFSFQFELFKSSQLLHLYRVTLFVI